MRSDHEWLRLLDRQRAGLADETDNLYACRLAGYAEDEARGMVLQALQLYRASLEVAPVGVVRVHLSRWADPGQP